MTIPLVRTFADPDAVSRAAADEFVRRAGRGAAERGRFTVALSGGATPQRLYQLLAEPPYRAPRRLGARRSLLGRRALRAAGPPRLQLPHGARSPAGEGPGSRPAASTASRPSAPTATRRPATTSGRRPGRSAPRPTARRRPSTWSCSAWGRKATPRRCFPDTTALDETKRLGVVVKPRHEVRRRTPDDDIADPESRPRSVVPCGRWRQGRNTGRRTGGDARPAAAAGAGRAADRRPALVVRWTARPAPASSAMIAGGRTT